MAYAGLLDITQSKWKFEVTYNVQITRVIIDLWNLVQRTQSLCTRMGINYQLTSCLNVSQKL